MPSTPGPASSTTPAASLPGMKGSSRFTWYCPAIISTSTKLTPRAWSATFTSPVPAGRRHLAQHETLGAAQLFTDDRSHPVLLALVAAALVRRVRDRRSPPLDRDYVAPWPSAVNRTAGSSRARRFRLESRGHGDATPIKASRDSGSAVRAHAHRAAAGDLPGATRDDREDRVGRAHVAREGKALRPARQSPSRRRPSRGMAARAARRAGVADLPGSRSILPAALCRAAGLGRRADRRASRLGAGGHARQAGLSRGGAASIARRRRRGAAACPRARRD